MSIPLARLFTVLALCASLPLAAGQIAGVKVPATLTVAGQPLALNGAGVRKKFFIKVYVGALYLPGPVTTAEAALAHTGPAAVTLRFVHSEVSKDKLVDGWNDGFKANLAEAEHAALRERITQFNALFQTVKAGDLIRLDYAPATGTRVLLNGAEQGVIEGRDFWSALLRIWLGEHPADKGLKTAMLGG